MQQKFEMKNPQATLFFDKLILCKHPYSLFSLSIIFTFPTQADYFSSWPSMTLFFQENVGLKNETLSLQIYQEQGSREHLQIWCREKWSFPLINIEEMAIS